MKKHMKLLTTIATFWFIISMMVSFFAVVLTASCGEAELPGRDVSAEQDLGWCNDDKKRARKKNHPHYHRCFKDAGEGDASDLSDAGDSLDVSDTTDASSDITERNALRDATEDSVGDSIDKDSETPTNGSHEFLRQSDTRAMYVWAGSNFMYDLWRQGTSSRSDFFSFSGAPHGYQDKSINRIALETATYYYCSESYHSEGFEKRRQWYMSCLGQESHDAIDDEPSQLRSFIQQAHNRGMKVEHLSGHGLWLADDSHTAQPLDIVREVLSYNRSSNSGERFDGIHFNIEPHIITGGPWGGDWWSQPYPDYDRGRGYNKDWMDRWISITQQARQLLDDYEAETGHAMTLTQTLAHDYLHYNQYMTEAFNDPQMGNHFISILNYEDGRLNPNGQNTFFYGSDDGTGNVVGGVVEVQQYIDQMPKVFYAETGSPAVAPDPVSFWKGDGSGGGGPYDGYQGMFMVLDALMRDYNSSLNLGWGIHHYEPAGFKAMDP